MHNTLENLNEYLKETFELQSIGYSSSNKNCFSILQDNIEIGTIAFNLLDGTPVNIYNDNINYKMIKPIVSATVSDFTRFKDWVISELIEMGYKYNPIVINDNEYLIDKTDVDIEVESLKIFLKMVR